MRTNTTIYNCPLDACAQCGDMDMALEYFIQVEEPFFFDVVSYTTLLKIHLSSATTNYTLGISLKRGCSGALGASTRTRRS